MDSWGERGRGRERDREREREIEREREGEKEKGVDAGAITRGDSTLTLGTSTALVDRLIGARRQPKSQNGAGEGFKMTRGGGLNARRRGVDGMGRDAAAVDGNVNSHAGPVSLSGEIGSWGGNGDPPYERGNRVWGRRRDHESGFDDHGGETPSNQTYHGGGGELDGWEIRVVLDNRGQQTSGSIGGAVVER